ncbi:MAG: PfkB family carbohydrate kinase [Bacteroidota bacterium]
MPLPPPDYLCIGHFCHDLHNGARLLGGTAAYAALFAHRLGFTTAVLTSLGPDFQFYPTFEATNIQLHLRPARQTTVFENQYLNGQRQQTLHQIAASLRTSDLPTPWRTPPIVHLCPIANELHFDFLQAFPRSLKGACLQGWLRRWDAQGRVRPQAMDWSVLEGLDVAILSREDLRGLPPIIPRLAELVSILIITDGANGAEVYHHNHQWHFPAFPTEERDPTGAGDTFATAFLLHYGTHGDIRLAMAYAHSAAALVVEQVGVGAVEPKMIEGRMGLYIKKYC